VAGRRCEGTTTAGNQCRKNAQAGAIYCERHGAEASALKAQQKEDVLAALPRVLSWAVAAEQARISHVTLKFWRDEDPEFEIACQHAKQAALDRVEFASMRRALGHEITEKVSELRTIGTGDTARTEMVVIRETTKWVYSDRAALMLLSGGRPEYRRGYEPILDSTDATIDAVAHELNDDPELSAQMDSIVEQMNQRST
jgi:hypothetical protein